MCSHGSSLDRLAEAVADVRDDRVDLLAPDDLEQRLHMLRRLADQVEAAFAQTAAAFDATEAYKESGARTCAAWLRHHLRMGAGEARRRVQVGRRLPDLGQVDAAFRNGDIGLAHVEVLAAATDDLGLDEVRAAEDSLVELARHSDPGDLREAVRTLRHAVDPGDLDARHQEALSRRHFSVAPVGDEFVVRGVLDAETGAMLTTVLDTMAKPEAGDERSAGQRRADAVGDLCRAVLDAGLPQDNGVRPHLTVVLSWEALTGRTGTEPGRLEGLGPVSTSLVRQLACDAAVSRVVIAPDGSPIELGRTARTASTAQRRGARVRDGGRCRVPGCRSGLVQLHHLVHWVDGGPTDLDQMVSLCPRHHRAVHSGRLKAESFGGAFRFRTRDGRELVDHAPAVRHLVGRATQQLLDVT